MSKKKRKVIRRNPWDGLRKTEIARRWPFKLPIIHHLISDQRKLRQAAILLKALKMRIKPSSNGEWFDIVGG